MKKYLDKDELKCIRCGNCERTCSKTYYGEINREKSAIKVSQGNNGVANIVVSNKCVACGKCVKNCPTGALKIKEYDGGLTL